MSSFTSFYETWFEQLHHLVHQLSTCLRPPTTPDHHRQLLHVVQKVMAHYAEYYRVKSLAVERDALSVFVAPWATTLERSLHWIGGWRPTTAFHLVYSESSIHFEAHIVDILRGHRTGDLGDLTPSQFRRVSDLQCETVKEENAISDELSEWQDGACELMGACTNLETNMGLLVSVLKKADELRLKTLRKVVELLTPQQAVEFLIAAAELQFGVRGWGLNQDRRRGNV
ncbi:transcription factor TGA5-like [Pyrus ussuriensis x Pyrus communis]|uniref:Transcription factor TGA5-like n=1 Tax=Pyrus ussuriensis x Pyrus communis TaxID=2448454 RepID=A0A5N5FQY5_9ROSA|nr:transcription factor TGA5-like [Pyrus ussuriensis x Pyrus communis]